MFRERYYASGQANFTKSGDLYIQFDNHWTLSSYSSPYCTDPAYDDCNISINLTSTATSVTGNIDVIVNADGIDLTFNNNTLSGLWSSDVGCSKPVDPHVPG
jgi:hypothetical protein